MKGRDCRQIGRGGDELVEERSLLRPVPAGRSGSRRMGRRREPEVHADLAGVGGIDWCARVMLPAVLRLVACEQLGCELAAAAPSRRAQDVVVLGLSVWAATRRWWEVRDVIRRCAGVSGGGGVAGEVCLLQLVEGVLAEAVALRGRSEVIDAVEVASSFWTARERELRVLAGWQVERLLRGDDVVLGLAVTAELVGRLCTDVVVVAAALAREQAALSGLSVQSSGAPLAVLHAQLAAAFASAGLDVAGE